MIIVPVKQGNIEKALKEFKRKYNSTKVGKELRERQQFVKPSVKKTLNKQKAIYKNKMALKNVE